MNELIQTFNFGVNEVRTAITEQELKQLLRIP